MNNEILGIGASMMVLLSFLMRGERNIRVINIFGALMFVAYGYLIHSFSTVLLNGILVIVHTERLLRAFYGKKKDVYKQDNGE